ncbi:hypothetical protein AXF42_Ash021564 [Apostasia shenzhenica]|uniref:Uncharacterized protein n=1 Tax=Apostasia shenzhenica TaxID=1088818 RepID=A0A2H9ZVS0_9ASPA|nr:hypothetical protein AXF42_Ash021564 [Apostasia shenzhenica]
MQESVETMGSPQKPGVTTSSIFLLNIGGPKRPTRSKFPPELTKEGPLHIRYTSNIKPPFLKGETEVFPFGPRKTSFIRTTRPQKFRKKSFKGFLNSLSRGDHLKNIDRDSHKDMLNKDKLNPFREPPIFSTSNIRSDFTNNGVEEIVSGVTRKDRTPKVFKREVRLSKLCNLLPLTKARRGGGLRANKATLLLINSLSRTGLVVLEKIQDLS